MMTRATAGPRPASTFDDALARAGSMIRHDAERGVIEVCRTTLLHHSRPTPRILVLFHGYTDCPVQFSGIAHLAHEAGLTVFSPLAPEHGRPDMDPRPLGDVTVADLAEHITRVIDIAAGLGDEVTVAGLSFGGVCSAWAARHRNEVAQALLISPSFAPFGAMTPLVPLLPAWGKALPERLLWWDPVRREEHRSGNCSYPRFSRRGIAEVFALGLDAWRGPARRTADLRRAVLVLNGADAAISPTAALHAFRRGLMPLAGDAHVHRYPASLLYPHDLVHPEGLNHERAADLWPELLAMIGVSAPEKVDGADE